MGKPHAAPAIDPLIGSLIAKLPPPGADFPRDRREAWLRMMMNAFDFAYGAVGEVVVARGQVGHTIPPLVRDETRPLAPVAAPSPIESLVKPPARAAHVIVGQDYYVDKDGFARCDYEFIDGVPVPNPGRRVLAAEAAGAEIYDYRGAARDRSTVVWADESVGAIPGMNFCGPG